MRGYFLSFPRCTCAINLALYMGAFVSTFLSVRSNRELNTFAFGGMSRFSVTFHIPWSTRPLISPFLRHGILAI